MPLFDNPTLQAPPLLQDTTSRTSIATQRLQNASTTVSQCTGNGDIIPASQQTSIGGTGTFKPRLGVTEENDMNVNTNTPSYGSEFADPCDDRPFISPSKILETSGICTSTTTRSSNNVVRSNPLPHTTLPPPCDVLRDDDQAAVNPSVFIGRNQSMSPHRHSSKVFVTDGEHRRDVKSLQSGVKQTASKIGSTGERQAACVDEVSRLTPKDATRSGYILKINVLYKSIIYLVKTYSYSISNAAI